MNIGTELSAADEEMFTIIPRPYVGRKEGGAKEDGGDEKGGEGEGWGDKECSAFM